MNSSILPCARDKSRPIRKTFCLPRSGPRFLLAVGLLLPAVVTARAQVQPPKPLVGTAGDTEPLLRLETGGPASYVTALAFSPDGRTLYAAGFDKIVRAWRWDGQAKRFVLDPDAFRVPVGPGRTGVLNVLAVSPDGKWIATSGLGISRVASRSREPGRIYPYIPPQSSEILRERATIYLFDSQTRAVRVLTGHAGEVLALAFAPSSAGKPPLLVSAAREPGAQAGSYMGRICLWDVSKAAFVDAQGMLQDAGALLDEWKLAKEPKNQIGLAIRHTGPQPKQVRVALAWGDGKLRTWEPGQELNARTREVEDGMDDPGNAWNNTAAYLSGSMLLTGSRVDDRRAVKGQLRVWDDNPGRRPEVRTQLLLDPPQGTEFLLVRALAAVSSKADGNLDHTAAIVRVRNRQSKEEAFWLLFASLPNLKPLTTTFLWKWTSRAPVIAASPHGRFLAMAGSEDHAIWVYSIEGLLKNEAKPQRLRSVGITMRSVAFVQKNKGQDLGLVLNETAKPVRGRLAQLAENSLVFDFSGRGLSANPNPQGWQIIDAALAGWRVKSITQQTTDNTLWRAVDWEGPGVTGQLKVKLAAAEQVTDYALVPPSRFSPVPLLALASWRADISEANLGLYNARTGEQIRQFSGHTEPVHCLAASPDGNLLASTADDQTISLWTMADVSQILGQQGMLPGVFIQMVGKRLVVKRVEESSPAFGKLEVGDSIAGLALKQGGKPRTFTLPFEYFNAFWDLKPSSPVWLDIDRNGVKRTVELTVGQGIDEQKPLLSLFIAGDARPVRQWIAWTPTGPYDTSGKEAERYLGWHFNPMRLEEPAKFARADAYRARFYKPKLLKALVSHGDYHKAIEEIDKPPPIPKPDLDVEVNGPGSQLLLADEQGQILVRSPDVDLRLVVAGPSFEQHQVQRMTWRLLNTGEKQQEVDLAKANGQTVPQSVHLPRERGIYRLEIRLHTREANPQEATRLMVLRYQPPPPEIRLDETWLKQNFDGKLGVPKIVREAKFKLRAQFAARSMGQTLQSSLVLQKQEQRLPSGAEIDREIELRPGENILTLRVQNQGALRNYEKYETEERSFVLVYNKKAAPQLLLKAVEPIAARAEPVSVEPGKPLLVGVSKVRLLGEVKALEKPEAVEIRNPKGELLAKVGSKQGQFAQVLELQPGSQEFEVLAKTPNSEWARTVLEIRYRPPLPLLELTEPRENLCLYEGASRPEIELKGVWTLPADPRSFTVQIRVFHEDRPVVQETGKREINLTLGEKELARPAALGQPGKLARVRLMPGDNRIQINLSNAWGAGVYLERQVSYRRPPRIVRIAHTDPGNKPFTDLIAQVESPSALPLTRVESNGRSYPPTDVQRTLRVDNGITTWEVRLGPIPLHKGDNPIRLSISNGDGRCLSDGVTDVLFKPEPEKPALVRIDKPKQGIREQRCPLPVHVTSETPIERAELRKGTEVVQTFDIAKQEKDPQGRFRLNLAPTVSLEDGTNAFKVVAINAGGAASDEVAISYVRVPVRLTFENQFDVVQERPTLSLIGHIRFQEPSEAPEISDKIRRMRFYVNDFQQRPAVELPRPGNTTEIRFSVTVLLNQERNKIEIDCPDLPPEAGSQQQFTVACRNPRKPARLHLLLVGIDVDNRQKDRLLQQAYRALQADYGTQGTLRSAVFSRVILHPYLPGREPSLLVGHIHTGMIRNGLRSIDRLIGTQGNPNDVVLIYWLGRDAVEVQGAWYLPTSDSPPSAKRTDVETMIPLAELLGGQQGTQGARVVLLDVAAPVSPPVSLSTTRAAVLRHAWSTQDQVIPGLLMAMETAAVSDKREVSLQDLQAAAESFRKKYSESLELTSNLELVPLADLILTHKP